MKEFWKQLIVRLILLDKTIPAEQQEFTPYEIAKASRELRISIVSFAKDIFLMTLGFSLLLSDWKVFYSPINLLMAE